MQKMKYLGFVCAAAALQMTSSFAAIRAVTPTAWDGNPECWQIKRHNEKMNVVTNGGAKIVFIGDSITHFWEGNGKDVFNAHLADGDYRMLNLGTSADRTEHVLWRLDNGELDGYEAKAIFLMIGTNKLGALPIRERAAERYHPRHPRHFGEDPRQATQGTHWSYGNLPTRTR